MNTLNTNLQILVLLLNFSIIGFIAYNSDNKTPVYEEIVEVQTGQNIPSTLKDIIGAIINMNGYSCKEVIRFEKHEQFKIGQCLNDQSIVSYKIDDNGKVTIE